LHTQEGKHKLLLVFVNQLAADEVSSIVVR
jgi:hypothetical protein